MPSPKVNRISPLSADEAKWTELKKIEWTDQEGKDRVWEAAARKTRGKSGIDAVAIAPILRHPNRPPSTIIVMQYRPPVEAVCVEFPAGLIDDGESPQEAAVRELKEETGYEGKVVDCSPTIVADPGLTNANMQMVTVEVELKEGDKEPDQHLDDGEFIERKVVPISELYDTLQGMCDRSIYLSLQANVISIIKRGWQDCRCKIVSLGTWAALEPTLDFKKLITFVFKF